MTLVCRFCKVHFVSEIQEIHACPDCLEEIKRTIIEDPKLKLELLEKALQDVIIIERIAKAVFEVECKNVGLDGAGSLAQFFCRKRKTTSQD